MKRSLLVGCISSLAILSGFLACGKPPVACDADYLTKEPQACADRLSLGFAREFGSGTFIGTRPPETLSIRNGGLADLSIRSVNYNGDPAFSVTNSPPMPADDAGVPTGEPIVIPGNKNFYMRVIFAPTEARLYEGTITVLSNAGVSPSLTFSLSGCGVPTDGGTSPCYRDGGR